MKLTRQETVTTDAREIVSQSPKRTSLAVHNLGVGTIYIAADNQVTTSSGFPIRSGASLSFAEIFGDDTTLAYWAIGTGSDIIAIMEQSVKRKEI